MLALAALTVVLPLCTISQLGPGQLAGRADARGDVVLIPFLSNNEHRCRVHAKLVMSLRSSGHLLRVRGNPATFEVDGPLLPGRFYEAVYRWRNWCGTDKVQVWLVLRGESGWMSEGVLGVPRCRDRTAPSSLLGPVRKVVPGH
jgi:hypothetical protein